MDVRRRRLRDPELDADLDEDADERPPRRRWWLPFLVVLVVLVIAALAGYGLAQLVAISAAAPRPSGALPVAATAAPTATGPASATPPFTGPAATASPDAASPDAASPGSPGPRTHVVAPGEWLSTIAERYGVTVEAILEANDVSDPDHIEVGQRLIIPDE